jgi:hypothetical protein
VRVTAHRCAFAPACVRSSLRVCMCARECASTRTAQHATSRTDGLTDGRTDELTHARTHARTLARSLAHRSRCCEQPLPRTPCMCSWCAGAGRCSRIPVTVGLYDRARELRRCNTTPWDAWNTKSADCVASAIVQSKDAYLHAAFEWPLPPRVSLPALRAIGSLGAGAGRFSPPAGRCLPPPSLSLVSKAHV